MLGIFHGSEKNKSAKECADVFRKYNVLGFISDCYDFLHLNSYERPLADAVEILAEREHISCEEALLRLSLSPVYDALYDYETGI